MNNLLICMSSPHVKSRSSPNIVARSWSPGDTHPLSPDDTILHFPAVMRHFSRLMLGMGQALPPLLLACGLVFHSLPRASINDEGPGF